MARKGWFKRWKGLVKQEVGEATGDRVVEAKGKAEAVTGRSPDEETVDAAVQHVRRRHGDVQRTPDAARQPTEGAS